MRKLLLLTLVPLVAMLATPALANMAPPYMPGDVVGEPRGAAKSVAIEREELALDLRPLAVGAPAQVTATYRVRNDGPAQSLSLVFVAPGLADQRDGPAVWLDGAPVPSEATTQEVLPDTWQPPKSTPGLGGGEDLYYATSSGDNRALGFTLALPPGRHDVRVSYPAVATAYSGDSPVRYWQLGYVLAPARDWASFGGLDVRVDLPAGWSAASEPAIPRSGDALVGSFDAIPADALALTAQAPVPIVIQTLPFAWIGGLVLSILVGSLVGRWLGHRRRRSLWALIPALLVGVAWMLLVLSTASVTLVGPIPEGQEAWVYGYGERMIALLTSPLALICGIIVTLLAAVVARRLVKPLTPARA